MESILYNVFLVLLGFCLRALLLDPSSDQGLQWKKNINWIMLVVSLLLCLLASLNVAFGLQRNLDAFVDYTGPGGAAEEFENISYWVNVMKTVDYVAQTFIGDGMLIYRCYIVFGKNWKIIVVSTFLWLGGAVCGAFLIYTFATLKMFALIDATQAAPYVDSMLALSLTMNVLTTALIVWRIWSVDRQNGTLMTNTALSEARTSKFHRVIRIIIDSAALYTVATHILVITYVTGSNLNYVTSDSVVQIIGISFNLIIIRVDAGKSFEGNTAKDATNRQPSFLLASQRKRQQSSVPLSLFQSTVDTPGDGTETELAGSKGITLDVEVNVMRDYGDSPQGRGTHHDVEGQKSTDYP